MSVVKKLFSSLLAASIGVIAIAPPMSQPTQAQTQNLGQQEIEKLTQKLVKDRQLAKTLHQFFPTRFSPSLSQLVFESSLPYSEILHSYKGWIAKVKKSNQQFLDESLP